MAANLSYYAVLSVIWCISKLPFFILYRISDLMYFIVFYLIPYRKKVVFNNLRSAFPEKQEAEIRQIAKKFYRHLCDFMIESFKPFTLSSVELKRRFHFTNPELIEEFNKTGRDYALVSGHYGNWEWNTILTQYAKRDALIIYRPLQNKIMDRLFVKIRSHYRGTRLTAMEHVFRSAMEYRNRKEPFLIYFIADQRPPRNNKFWTTFLHQPTSFFNGTEKLSRKLDMAVIFMHIQKTKRGFYEVSFTRLFDSVKDLPENAVTLAFVDALEREINRQPEFWLWSHKRWKHKPDASTLITPR